MGRRAGARGRIGSRARARGEGGGRGGGGGVGGGPVAERDSANAWSARLRGTPRGGVRITNGCTYRDQIVNMISLHAARGQEGNGRDRLSRRRRRACHP